MIYRENFRRAAERQATRGQVRLGAHAMAVLAGLVATALVAAIFFALNSVMPATAEARATPEQYPEAIAAVQQRFTGEVEDPLIEISKDIYVRQSNLEGVDVDGVRYYYAILGHQSFDPVSMGRVQRDQIEIIYRSEGAGFPLIIYHIVEQ